MKRLPIVVCLLLLGASAGFVWLQQRISASEEPASDNQQLRDVETGFAQLSALPVLRPDTVAVEGPADPLPDDNPNAAEPLPVELPQPVPKLPEDPIPAHQRVNSFVPYTASDPPETRIISLQAMDAEEAREVLRHLFADRSMMATTDRRTNSLIVRASPNDLEDLIALLKALDTKVPAPSVPPAALPKRTASEAASDNPLNITDRDFLPKSGETVPVDAGREDARLGNLDKVREAVNEAFDEQQRRQLAEIEELTARLNKLAKIVREREQKRAAVIDRRLTELLAQSRMSARGSDDPFTVPAPVPQQAESTPASGEWTPLNDPNERPFLSNLRATDFMADRSEPSDRADDVADHPTLLSAEATLRKLQASLGPDHPRIREQQAVIEYLKMKSDETELRQREFAESTYIHDPAAEAEKLRKEIAGRIARIRELRKRTPLNGSNPRMGAELRKATDELEQAREFSRNQQKLIRMKLETANARAKLAHEKLAEMNTVNSRSPGNPAYSRLEVREAELAVIDARSEVDRLQFLLELYARAEQKDTAAEGLTPSPGPAVQIPAPPLEPAPQPDADAEHIESTLTDSP